ncbi:MAG: MMPL family transporter [Deltaproteobacteria bacterium]|nr:MMPL family transporter [Deltaproteobacteria bacterium]
MIDFDTGEPRLYLDPAVDSMLPTEDEGRAYYDRIRRIFGSDETLLLAVHHPDGVFTSEMLAAIQRIGERVEEIEGIHHVVSLATAPIMRSADGELEISPLFGTVPTDPDRLDELRKEAIENPLFKGSLVSDDGRTAGILVYLMGLPELEFTEKEIDLQVQAVAEEEVPAGSSVWLTGGPHIKSQTARFLIRDLSIIIPLCFLVMAAIALVSFRSFRGVAIPVSTIGIALLWTLAGVADIGQSLNLVTTAVPLLVLVVGFAYAVHVVSTYYEAIDHPEEGGDGDSAAYRGLMHVVLPTLLAGVTTAAGFLSITTSNLGAIKEFGLYCTIGVVASMVASLTFAPALLSLLEEPAARTASKEAGVIDRLLSALANFNVRHRVGILVMGGVIALVALVGMTRIKISTDFVSNFDENSTVRRSYQAVSDSLSGASQIYVVLETDYRDAWREPANLALIEDLQEWLEKQPEIGVSTSIVDYLKLINRGFNHDDPDFYRIPASKRLVTQLLFFGGGDEIERFVDSQYQVATALVRTTAVDSGAVSALVARIEQRLEELPMHVEGRVTGNTVLVADTIDDIAYGQALSLATAFIAIFAILAVLFTSFRMGFMALIPNALPVLVYFGALGWSGITLNATTGLVACLVLGIAVDDTIHFFTRFSAAAKERADASVGVREAIVHVGRPVTYTSIALVLGFSILLFSTLKNQAEFGGLAAFTLGFAWLVDMTFTPAIAARLKVVTIWEVLSLDLGEEPQKAIPLFAGLSKTQARIAALMTDIIDMRPGEQLIEVGQKGRGFYVVIEGELVSHLMKNGKRVDLARHGRGDVVGEVGLFRGERTANVHCVDQVRLVYFEPEDMDRLRRRYPRIAAQVFSNLGQVLAGRLAAATARLDV